MKVLTNLFFRLIQATASEGRFLEEENIAEELSRTIQKLSTCTQDNLISSASLQKIRGTVSDLQAKLDKILSRFV
jgi:hypothetical protein